MDSGACGGDLRAWLDGHRCDDCTAKVERLRQIAASSRDPYPRLPVDLYLVGAEHGSRNGYARYGCGCGPCRAAYNRSVRERAARRRARKGSA